MASSDESKDLVHRAAAVAANQVGAFTGTLFGGASVELNEILAETVRSWRFARSLKHREKAMRQMEEAGLDPRQVPLRTLVPLLENASLEDDEGMVDRYASLLANAASPEGSVPPSFPTILRDLEPVQAQMLDSLYDALMPLGPSFRVRFGIGHEGMIGAGFDLDEATFRYHIDNLARLRLVLNLGVAPTINILESMTHTTEYQPGALITLTELGRVFVRACRPPSQPDPPVRYETVGDWREAQRDTSGLVQEPSPPHIDGGGP